MMSVALKFYAFGGAGRVDESRAKLCSRYSAGAMCGGVSGRRTRRVHHTDAIPIGRPAGFCIAFKSGVGVSARLVDIEIRRMISEGDLVLIHSNYKTWNMAGVDIFGSTTRARSSSTATFSSRCRRRTRPHC
jgi:hypothetical protein